MQLKNKQKKSMTTEFSSETMLARRQWNNIFKVQEEGKRSAMKISFKNKGKINIFTDKSRELFTSRPIL